MTDSDPAYERGYFEQGEFLDGKSLAEAEHILAERLASTSRNSYNRGGDDATRDYIQRKQEEGV